MIFIYSYLKHALDTYYDRAKVLKESPRGTVTLLRHRSSGGYFVLREFCGSTAVYEKLLTVRSPHLPQILEVAADGEHCLVLEEYVTGDDLAFLLESAVCSPKQTRSIVMDVCRALWVLHELGAVHRDVKPENIRLRGKHAVLMDFNASRVMDPGQSADTVILGTTGYAAPEQYGLSQTDGRADIYSLGVTMNVMLTGRHPSQMQISGRMGRIIQRCTMLAPEKRYQTVQDLMAVL